MRKFILALLITAIPLAANATTWTGTSSTWGNTTYHNFRSNRVQVIETSPRYQQDNSAAIAGGVAIGIVAGALLVKGISSCMDCFRKKPMYYQQNNYYNNDYTQQYEYVQY